jgi:beta-lactamase class A
MTAAPSVAELEASLAFFAGTVSVWCGPPDGRAAYAREPAALHYAASTMKVAVLAAVHLADEQGALDLDADVPVENVFVSARPGSGEFGCDPDYDNDAAVWDMLGGTAPLRWLTERMIVKSSNLATNLVLSQVGLPAVADIWRRAGARHSVTARGIEDSAARAAGLANLVTAADLALLLSSIAAGTIDALPSGVPPLATPATCEAILAVLLAQEYGEDVRAGLPPGTRVAQKDGWVPGVRHSAAVVLPDDAPSYVLVVCTTDPSREELDADDRDGDHAASELITSVAAASWVDRWQIAESGTSQLRQ